MMRTGAIIRAVYVITMSKVRGEQWIDTLFDECQQLGGVYVKFLQQIAATEMFTGLQAVGKKYAKVFDQVQLEPLDIHVALRREIGDRADQLTEIEAEPFAAGSFAQVYRAKLDSKVVILKVLRPSIKRNLTIDCRLLMVCACLAQPLVKNNLLDLPRLAGAFIHATKRETNYLDEANAATYIHDYFMARNENVVIPHTFLELCSRSLLVQEFVDGIPLTEVLEIAQNDGDGFAYVRERIGSDMTKQLIVVGEELLTATLQADVIMTDPHPGNIMLLPEDKIALIDFGLTSAAPAHRSAFLGMIGQYRALYEGTVDMGTLAVAMIAFYDYELYQALNTVARHGELATSLRDYISQAARQDGTYQNVLAVRKQIAQLFLEQLNANNRFAINIDERDIVLQKAMHGFLSSARLACGERYRTTKYWQMVYTALKNAEDRAYQEGVKETSLVDTMPLEDAQEIIVDWMSKVAERDRAAFNALTTRGATI